MYSLNDERVTMQKMRFSSGVAMTRTTPRGQQPALLRSLGPRQQSLSNIYMKMAGKIDKSSGSAQKVASAHMK
jgi:hypothetical protein